MKASPLVAGYRGPGPGRPAVPLPPESMALLRYGRLLKRWRYVGVFGPELSLCVASVRVGPLRQSFWAIWDRGTGELHERTVRGKGGVELGRGSIRVRDRGVDVDLRLEEEDGVEVVVPYGSGYVWTTKQGGVPAHGTVAIGGRPIELDARAIVDDWAGYPPRRTSWRWSAGVGQTSHGERLAWNIVEGINDPSERSERTVWLDGGPAELPPASFAADLSAVGFPDGESLRFAAEATRRRSENFLVVRSSYEQPFGTFCGTLPGGIEVAEGFGVMERHDAVW